MEQSLDEKEKFRPDPAKVKELVDERNWTTLREYLSASPAPDLADLLEELKKTERVLVFRLLPRDLSADVFSHLEPGNRDHLIRELTDEEARRLLADLRPDDRAGFLGELPGQLVQRWINLLSPGDLRETRFLLGYPEESAGRLMTPDYVAVRPAWTIQRALEHIRRTGRDRETVDVVYVVDDSWKLLDALDLRRFILAPPEERVESIMDYTFVSIFPFEDREQAVKRIQHYDLIALPVVDEKQILLGIVTFDDVLDVAREETTEDFQKTAAVDPLGVSYGESRIGLLYRKRIVWLIALFGVNSLAAGVVAAYEQALSAIISLAFFIPLLMSSGGNVGAQSAALIIRALGTGDLKVRQWFKTGFRELGTGILLGLTMAIPIWVLGVFKAGIQIGLIAALAMFCTVAVANLLGVFLPMILTKFGADPAMASSPLITSLADVVGLLIYFSLVARFLGLF